ncbi:hypothetical protein KSF73_08060 [Burkholderiaceae bacterium DAT-1]|nr:hypothetical protein [Burkholderiaceae bacterium DAT-1]
MTFRITADHGNEALKDMHFPMLMAQMLETLKAEAAYFSTVPGGKSGYFVCEAEGSSDPVILDAFQRYFGVVPALSAEQMIQSLEESQALAVAA